MTKKYCTTCTLHVNQPCQTVSDLANCPGYKQYQNTSCSTQSDT